MIRPSAYKSVKFCWRHIVLLAIAVGSLAFMLSMPPWPQDLSYHNFADQRAFFNVQNFMDVMSNVPFLFVGIAGMRLGFSMTIGSRPAWFCFFSGVAIVSAGSAYYHWNPTNDALVWDRLPMTIGFMGLFVALVAEFVEMRLVRWLLLPALVAGMVSVLYWHWFDDLRFYAWIQLIPLLTIPAVMLLFKPMYSHQWLLLLALAFYVLAKISEAYDKEVFTFTQNLMSGHSIKHLLAATGCYSVFVMLNARKLNAAPSS